VLATIDAFVVWMMIVGIAITKSKQGGDD